MVERHFPFDIFPGVLQRDMDGVCVQLDKVRDAVVRDGTTLTAVNGNKVKNPDVTTWHSLINEKNALLPKIIKFIANTDVVPEDELAAFISK